MTVQTKKHYAMDELEQYYLEVESLYDLTGNLVNTLEGQEPKYLDAQLILVEPLINEITDATDVLTEEFLLLAKGARHHISNTASKSRIESSLRRIYTAINDYRARSARVYGKTASKLRETTDRVVDAIQEQVEKVVAIFVEFIQLSLQSIMNKVELGLLFQRQQKLALAMHAISQHPGGSGSL